MITVYFNSDFGDDRFGNLVVSLHIRYFVQHGTFPVV